MIKMTQDASESSPAGPDRPPVHLSPRELLVVTLYADGHSQREVAVTVGLTVETVRSYLKHARSKFHDVARDAPTRALLRERLVEDGLLPPEPPTTPAPGVLQD